MEKNLQLNLFSQLLLLGGILDFVYFLVGVPAVGLAEEVLAVREDTLRVQDIPNFTSLVHKFSSQQLASFCRVLAMVVFEPEVG